MDINIKRNCEYLVEIFKPIACALDKIQSNTCTIAKAVTIYNELEITTNNWTTKDESFQKTL